jgi:gluconate 2-dehydrogenase gamma chain
MPRLASAASAKVAVLAANAPSVDAATDYRSLSPDEAVFTETMVNVLCPADHLTPNGVTCGLARLIDRQLAGDFGTDGGRCAPVAWAHEEAQSRSQLPLTPEQFFKDGIAAANRACQERFRLRFDQLAASDASAFLRDIAGGRVIDAQMSLVTWSNQLVDPLLIQACFAGPIYDGYCNRVFWKLFGHPGGPA